MIIKSIGKLCIGVFISSSAGILASEWKNPGGMWRPSDLVSHESILRTLGLELPLEELTEPLSDTLQKVVSLGGCSGTFVSRDGLIVTNFHCVRAMLNDLSNEDKKTDPASVADYAKTGFHARSLAAERNVGSAQKIFITQSYENVTHLILEGMSPTDGLTGLERIKLVEDRKKVIVAAAEKTLNIRADIHTFSRGDEYILIKKLELKDVRMVYAPPRAIGSYGGETDNWHWPRHTGDFAFIRAYVSPDGNPNAYSLENIPYQSAHYAQIAGNDWLKEKDLVMVMGYPGLTKRLQNPLEVEMEIERNLPVMVTKYQSLRTLLKSFQAGDSDLAIKVATPIARMSNMLKKYKSSIEALQRIDYLAKKITAEQEAATWTCAHNPEYSDAFLKLIGHVEKSLGDFESKGSFSDLTAGLPAELILLVKSALEIVLMAEERLKPDAERLPEYQERNQIRWIEAQKKAQVSYDKTVSKSVLMWAINRALQIPTEQEIPLGYKIILSDNIDLARINLSYIQEKVDEYYEGTTLSVLENRLDLFHRGTIEELSLSKDLFIILALGMRAEYRAFHDKTDSSTGDGLFLNRNYVQALKTFEASKGRVLASDANSTLRITYGQVKGFTSPTRGFQAPFTNVLDLLSKHKPADAEFEVPVNVLEAIAKKDFEPYGSLETGVVLDTLGGLDITGGNSGSGAFDKKGRLVGLAFDGNEETQYSDWYYDDEEVRAILVDARYVLWFLDKAANASELLLELIPIQ